MKLKYDNIEDVKVKLASTYCMYKGKAVLVKLIELVSEEKYNAHGSYMFNGRSFVCDIDDPDFNCSNYNIGYVNTMKAGAWFYRVPLKQYKQGLRHDQVRMRYTNQAFSDIQFSAGKSVCAMLENNYTKFKSAAELLREGEANIVAFHKNFAMIHDSVHKDFILEYKGVNIGFTKDLKNMELMEEYAHLHESLKEAIGD